MVEIAAYEREPYRRHLRSLVLETGHRHDRPFAILEDTIFFPAGGGQPADRGRLGRIPVTDVAREGDTVLHFLDAPVSLGPVELELDWERRFDHMQQHTAQHILTALARQRLGWATIGFHLAESVSYLDLAVSSPPQNALGLLSEAAAEVIREARPVNAYRTLAEDPSAQAARSRGLPADFQGTIRLVEIAGLDLNTCGGTHVVNTAEVESIVLVGREPMHGGTRVYYVAGRRLRQRLQGHEQRNTRLRDVLGAPDEEILATITLKLGQLREAERRARRREDLYCDSLAKELINRGVPFFEAHFPDETAAFLQLLARKVSTLGPSGWGLLTSAGGGGPAFAIVSPADRGSTLREIGPRVAAALGGRGGGSGPVFQGKAGDLKTRDEALAVLQAATEDLPPPHVPL